MRWRVLENTLSQINVMLLLLLLLRFTAMVGGLDKG